MPALRRTVVALAASLGLGFAGLYLVVGEALFRPGTYRVQNLSALLVAVVAIAFVAKWCSPALRIGLLCRGQKIPLPYRSALLVHLFAMFAAALAPNNTGFAPATVAALSRLGVPVGRGIGVAVQIVVLDLVFFAWAVPASVVYLTYSEGLELPAYARAAVFAAACLAIAAAAVLSRRPRPVVRLILAVARWRYAARFASRLRKAARDYYRSARAFVRMPASRWLALHLVTAVSWSGGFVLLWALIRLYGVEADLLATVALVTAITVVSHFVPTPGAAGFMELAVGLGIGGGPGRGAAAAVLIWRLASFYGIFLFGPLASWLLYLSRPAAAATDGLAEGPRDGSGVNPRETGKP